MKFQKKNRLVLLHQKKQHAAIPGAVEKAVAATIELIQAKDTVSVPDKNNSTSTANSDIIVTIPEVKKKPRLAKKYKHYNFTYCEINLIYQDNNGHEEWEETIEAGHPVRRQRQEKIAFEHGVDKLGDKGKSGGWIVIDESYGDKRETIQDMIESHPDFKKKFFLQDYWDIDQQDEKRKELANTSREGEGVENIEDVISYGEVGVWLIKHCDADPDSLQDEVAIQKAAKKYKKHFPKVFSD